MTTTLQNGGQLVSHAIAQTPPKSEKETSKDFLRKAAESALISSFVDLSFHSSSKSTQNGNGSVSSVSGTSKPLQHQHHHPVSNSRRQSGQSKKVVIEIDRTQSQSKSLSYTSIFVKAIPPTSLRALREIKFYDQFVKELYPPVVNKYPKSHPTIPECYLTHENGQVMLFLENLKTSGFKNCESGEFDFNHALLSVETLARFHAQSYFLLKQLGGKAKGRLGLGRKHPYLQLTNSHTDKSGPLCSKVYEKFFEQILLKCVEAENPSLAFKLRRKYQDPENCFRKATEILENEKHANDDLYAVCHGDFRVENMLFKYGAGKGVEPGEPLECRMVDFKNSRIAPMASDLVYFMFTSLNAQMRDDFEEKLIAFYCDSFEAQLSIRYKQSGSDLTPAEFNIEDFHRKMEDQYRRMLEFGFFSCVAALPLISSGFSGVLENLAEIHLDGNSNSPSVLDSLNNEEKFQQFAKECLAYEQLKEMVIGVVKRLVKAKIF